MVSARKPSRAREKDTILIGHVPVHERVCVAITASYRFNEGIR